MTRKYVGRLGSRAGVDSQLVIPSPSIRDHACRLFSYGHARASKHMRVVVQSHYIMLGDGNSVSCNFVNIYGGSSV